jgi:transcriptional regulator with XRE-family HTH domain
MAVTIGGELREWRRSRGWDVPELARRLRRAADEPVAEHDGLVRMIRAWERGDHRPSERYELLYRRLGLPSGNENGAEPQPTPTRRQEGTEPVRRRTFVELTGISLAGAMLPGAAAASPATSIEPLVLMLTGTVPERPRRHPTSPAWPSAPPGPARTIKPAGTPNSSAASPVSSASSTPPVTTSPAATGSAPARSPPTPTMSRPGSCSRPPTRAWRTPLPTAA